MTDTIMTGTEILGAFLSADVKGNVAQLKNNTGEFIAEKYDLDLSDVDLKIVENTDDTIHLSLPYYASLESISVSDIDETELARVSGTEPVTLILGLAFGAAGVAAGVGGVGAIVGTQVRANK